MDASNWPPPFPAARILDDSAGGHARQVESALPASIKAERTPEGRWRCRFTLQDPRGGSAAGVAGSFNRWKPDATPLTRRADGRLEAWIELEPGEYRYKFVLDGHWIVDPENDSLADDGFGGVHSVLVVGGEDHFDASHAVVGDGHIEVAALEHRPTSATYRQRLRDGRHVLRYRTLSHDVERVELALQNGERLAMAPVFDSGRCTWWEVEVGSASASGGYTFVLHDGATTLRHSELFELADAASIQCSPPEWAQHAVWYQIMLDRFRNGDASNDPADALPWTSDWSQRAEAEALSGMEFRESKLRRHYGGDLAGLRERLPYLKELGINALYLNPIFQATTHHKYNATSYLHVDEQFGTPGDYAAAEEIEDLNDPATWTFTPTDRLFLEVLAGAKSLGMRVILDGVWNHVGEGHPAFRDVREKGLASYCSDWFEVTSFEPFKYEGWAGLPELPVFAKSADGFVSEAVKRHIFAATRRWMDPDGDGDPSDGIDGWRLDVPMEIAMPFWREWCALVKSINPDAYISGEVWDRAEAWLDGRSFDAVMNYPFADAALHWIGGGHAKISASACDRQLAELRLVYPREAHHALMNLVDSHDTARLVSKLMHAARTVDDDTDLQQRPILDDEPSADAYARARLIVLLQMTYVGAPMIYYGDEVGMWGADDPDNRRPMWWDDLGGYEEVGAEVDAAHRALYAELIKLRVAHSALRAGRFRTLLTDDERDLWVFLREDGTESVLVALNASVEPADVAFSELEGDQLESSWNLVFGSENSLCVAKLRLPAVGGVVLAR